MPNAALTVHVHRYSCDLAKDAFVQFYIMRLLVINSFDYIALKAPWTDCSLTEDDHDGFANLLLANGVQWLHLTQIAGSEENRWRIFYDKRGFSVRGLCVGIQHHC